MVFCILRFAFFKVLPGDYEILATHPTWALKEVSISVMSLVWQQRAGLGTAGVSVQDVK